MSHYVFEDSLKDPMISIMPYVVCHLKCQDFSVAIITSLDNVRNSSTFDYTLCLFDLSQ